MDLYNNSIGIQIAIANPDASASEFEALVGEAITNGDLVVIDSSGNLAFSDEVAVGDTGHPQQGPAIPGRDPADWDAS